MRVVAVVLGAGRGVRLGADRPKALVEIEGRSLLGWSALALSRAQCVDAVLPVVASGATIAIQLPEAQLLASVEGGETRQDSVAAALASLAEVAPTGPAEVASTGPAEVASTGLEWVLVHDAARCLVSPAEVDAVFEAAQPTGAAILVAPVTDTLKRRVAGKVVQTLARDSLVRALTPQCFRLAVLNEAMDKARRDGFTGTDCSSLVERLGVEVRTCEGSDENFKVTTAENLERARQIIQTRGRPA